MSDSPCFHLGGTLVECLLASGSSAERDVTAAAAHFLRAQTERRTPNTNHIGFYVAKAKGLYDAAGLNVRLLSPHCDGYKRTPASRWDTPASLPCRLAPLPPIGAEAAHHVPLPPTGEEAAHHVVPDAGSRMTPPRSPSPPARL